MISKHKRIIMWALTYRCNMNCSYCYLNESPKLKKAEITSEQRLTVANKLIESKTWKPEAVWLTGGEASLIEELPELIKILEVGHVKTVINSNGYLSHEKIDKILESKPRGINISIDFVGVENDLLRGNTEKVIESITYISNHKNDYTILGASIVLNEANISRLHEISLELEKIGIEYISLNPFYDENNKRMNPAVGKILDKELEKIKRDNKVLLPSEIYMDMLNSYYINEKHDYMKCPATTDYLFISPWGAIYPCSNEFWHSHSKFDEYSILESENMVVDFKKLQCFVENQGFSNHSDCYGSRCLGCWKLYFDNVFI